MQGTKRALAHSHLRVGDVPGEYPSVCTGPYYRVQKKKKKKSTMHIIMQLVYLILIFEHLVYLPNSIGPTNHFI